MTAPVCPIGELEKVLLCTDGSEFCEGAINEAITLAKTCSSRLYILSVVETNPEYEALAPQLVDKADREARDHLDSLKVRAEAEGVDCETIIRRGQEPHKEITAEAAEREVRLIILGRTGRKGLKRLMMGDVTALVIGHAPCNVIVVPQAAGLPFAKILIATDGSEHSLKAAEEAVSIARRCGSTMAAVSVVGKEADLPTAEDYLNSVRDIVVREGMELETYPIVGTSYEGVTATAQVKGADLIVVGSYGRRALKSLLMGGVTERVIGLAHCAVLVVRSIPA